MDTVRALFCPERSAQDLLNAQIDKDLKQDKEEQRNTYNILLLGTGGCGKSTFLKQMKILAGQDGTFPDPFPEIERETKWKKIVFNNIYSGIRVLLHEMTRLGIRFSDSANEKRGNEILAIESFEAFLTFDQKSIRPDCALKVAQLWSDRGVQKCFERRSEYQLEDSVQYFLENLENVLVENYIPSVEHVLHVRIKTTVIYSTDIPLTDDRGRKTGTLRMIDVGGQRNFREKWINYFDSAVSVIFITSLSEFNLKLEEDQNVSRTQESLGLFRRIVEADYFQNTSVILFLNKKDLLQQKLDKGVEFASCFEEFDFPEFDPDDYEESDEYPKEAMYMQDLYEKEVEHAFNDERQLYRHITCATDTNNVRVIWTVVRHTILEHAMRTITLN